MKTLCSFVSVLAATLVLHPGVAQAQLNIPSDGSDGELIITTNTVIDLNRAATGVWSVPVANPGKGIYDPEKWAVVFKYSSVFIASNATVTFKNHASRAPVVWLVSGDVTINGEVSLKGQDWGGGGLVSLPEPGPGGFRGGGGIANNVGNGGGFGPGGVFNSDGVYGTGSMAYGNPQLIPLIGGSGGSGGNDSRYCGPGNGAAGGGAILIASARTITVGPAGIIHAPGGNGYSGGCGFLGAYGSGGAVRLVADTVEGSGRIEALGRNSGRVRIEANTASGSLSINPVTIAVPPAPLTIWAPVDAPTVKVVSVDEIAAPADPRANISVSGSDLILVARTNTILLQTQNFPTNGVVNVHLTPRNSQSSILQASLVSGSASLAIWQLKTVLPLSHTVVQARAIAQ